MDEALELVERWVDADGPVAVYYAPTPKGEDFQPVFAEISNWADRWQESEHSTTPD